MPVYAYKAMDEKGRTVNGIVDADTIKGAKAKLRRDNKFPTEITEAADQQRVRGKGLAMEINFSRLKSKVKLQDLAIMTRQLATLVGAGIPVVESLTALSKQVESEALKRSISHVREKVNEGSSLAGALREHPKVFNDLYVNMVDSGEQSGTLDIVLERLADFIEDQLAMSQKIRAALTYPAFMGVVLFGIIMYMVTVVIPKVSTIFDGMDKALPALTLALLSFSSFISSYWWLLILLVGVGVYFFKRWKSTPKGHHKWDGLLLQMPYVGALIRKVAVSRFSRTLGTMLASGVPIITAMDIVKNVVQNEVIKEAVESGKENIREGESIAKPLERSGVFPPMVIHMIEVGEKTGELENMLNRVSIAYDNEVEATINGLTALLEPIMILVMGGVVGFAVLSILLPIMDMTSGLN
jgi:general secretion pathway protein F